MKPDNSKSKKSTKPEANPSPEPSKPEAFVAKAPSKVAKTKEEDVEELAPVKAKAKSAKAAAEVEIPSILLEDDKPSKAAGQGPGQRYALGITPTAEHAGEIETSRELPESYNTGKLILVARDPHWIYVRWDLSREEQRKFNALSVDRHMVVRLFLNDLKSQPVDIIHVHPESTHWFVHVNVAGAKYLAELGYFDAHGLFTLISTSAATMTPPDRMSDDLEVQFANIPSDIPLPQLMEMARKAIFENIPIEEVILQLKSSGYQIPEATAIPGEKWTPEREKALANIITMDHVRRVWMGSVEITELIRRQWMHEMTSMAAAQFSVPGSDQLGVGLGSISSVSSVTSPFGGQHKGKGFWFNVNAELIMYGASEPDAEVTLGGIVIKLRPDGTFSYRFILPDGQYELPAVAISNDRTDKRTAELAFSRSTYFHGEVGHHPQDPAMKPPRVENIS